MRKDVLFSSALALMVFTQVNAQAIGALTYGRFSVSNTKQVLFSQGNLQYNSHEDQFRFAENQYDIVGATNAQIGSDVDEWMDLFGWATSGYNGKNPFLNSATNTSYGNGNNDIADTEYDWGVHNEITNGLNNEWRTLTAAEWDYLLFTRSSTLLGFATVAGVKGIVLLEDDWTVCPEGLSFHDVLDGTTWTANVYDADEWYQMEIFGAVFLPAAGYREVAEVSAYSGNYAVGAYWSATHYGSAGTQACAFSFTKDEINGDAFSNDPMTVNNYCNRSQGNSVRLVVDYEATSVQQYTVTLAVYPEDADGVVEFTNGDGTGVYDENTEAEMSATANINWEFLGWDIDGDDNPDVDTPTYTHMVTGDITITAIFSETTPTILDKTETETYAVKKVCNGQLLIEKNGKTFNAQGAQIQ